MSCTRRVPPDRLQGEQRTDRGDETARPPGHHPGPVVQTGRRGVQLTRQYDAILIWLSTALWRTTPAAEHTTSPNRVPA
ncbi:hypothetical protein [Streptomyces sp. NPDC088794]|uniref:hypothetical protein n=1 Tax=Streptomyces sp. NPDC088794 TaxID=3365902 RepID=UPI0038247C27